MSLLTRIFRPNSVETRAFPASIHNPLSKFGAWVSRIFNDSQETLDNDSVFGLSAVWRAINVISEPLASIGFNHYEKLENGDVCIKEGKLNTLLSKQPSPYYSSFTWIQTFMVHILVTGNAFIEIRRLGSGEIGEFLLLDPSRLEEIIFLGKGKLGYKFTGRDKMITSENIIHIPGLGFNGFMGKNPIEAHRETLLTDRGSRDYANNFYANGAFLSGTLNAPGPISEPAYQRMKNSWQDAYGGAKNAGMTPLLEEGVTFSPLRLSPLDAGWVQTRDKVIEDISRIFGVPMHRLSVLDRATFSNIEHQDLELNKYTYTPWASRVEAEFNRKLFPNSDKEFVRFDIDALLRGDIDSMTKYLESHYKMGTLNRNEIRRKYLHLKGVGPDGDVYFIQGNNMIPVEMAIAGQTIGQIGEPDQETEIIEEQ